MGEGKHVVLVLASTYPRWPGDPEPGFVHELCRRLTDRFDVVAVVPDAPGAQPSGVLDGVEVIRYRYAPRRLQTLVNNGGIANNLRRFPWKWLLMVTFVIGQYAAARAVLRRRRIDVIHAHWLLPQGLVARLVRGRVPMMVTSHGGDLFGLRGKLLTRLKRAVAAESSAMTVVSSAMRDEAARIGLKPPEVKVLPMGVDLRQRFVPDASIARDSDMILAVGRLVPKKGLCQLLDAMPRVSRERPQVRLEIVGFGPEEATLRAQAVRLGIAQRVHFRGAVPQAELPTLYRRAGLLAAPFIRDEAGDQEGLPVVLMEAIGCGCPVVVGDVAGVEDLLGDAKHEVCVDPRDTPALAGAILAVLADPVSAAECSARIRDAAGARVDWGHVAARYGDLLASCIRCA
jgi:glycosyltransferase involved in cell wall biosynthesis